MARFGEPTRWTFEIPMTRREFALLDHTGQDGRWQDATVIIRAPSDGITPHEPDVHGPNERGTIGSGDRFVAVAKHWYPDGIVRFPSGTVKPGEAVADTACREAWEETGLDVRLVDYLLATEGTFVSQEDDEVRRHPWRSHVFLAEPVGGELRPHDVREIRDVEVVTAAAFDEAIHERMLSVGVGGFVYRVGLQERALTRLGVLPAPRLVP